MSQEVCSRFSAGISYRLSESGKERPRLAISEVLTVSYKKGFHVAGSEISWSNRRFDRRQATVSFQGEDYEAIVVGSDSQIGGMMRSQAEKGKIFRELHQRDRAFIIPNPWDVGTARLLARLGFEALATTSAGFAFSIGQRDNTVGRERMIAHVRDIAAATDLPVSADLENGFGDDPETAAETIGIGAAAGLVGGSIEDSNGRKEDPIYEIGRAAERIRAAADVAHSLPFTFTLTARAENYLFGRLDLKDTIKRLQAYQQAGADVLYAPGLATKDDIAAVVSSVDRPVNILMGLAGVNMSVTELSAIGVKRISVGSVLSRVALSAFIRAAEEMRENGTFAFGEDVISFRDISAMFTDPR